MLKMYTVGSDMVESDTLYMFKCYMVQNNDA